MAKIPASSRRQSTPAVEEVRVLIREMLTSQLDTMRRTQKDLGIDAPGLEVMLHLSASGELNPKDIAKKLGASSAATSVILQRLEDLGHITRHNDPADGRKILVVPVKGSIQAAYKSGNHVVRNTVELLESLSASELRVIKKFLTKLVAAHKIE